MKHRILALLLAVLMVTALLPFGASAAGEKLIAVTFDDGPSQYTSQLLDGLAARGAKVTFFMQGVNAQSNTAVIRRAWNEGHQICSHTYNHPSLTGLSAGKIRSQLDRTDSILDNAIGFDLNYMLRPPYGNYNQTVLNVAGVPCFFWSVDTLDWKSRNSDSVYSEFMSHARDGSIVLLQRRCTSIRKDTLLFFLRWKIFLNGSVRRGKKLWFAIVFLCIRNIFS